MSLTHPVIFSCPYCMVQNDLDIDEVYDVGQELTVDCQICCSPITVFISQEENTLLVHVKQENE